MPRTNIRELKRILDRGFHPETREHDTDEQKDHPAKPSRPPEREHDTQHEPERKTETAGRGGAPPGKS